MTTQIVFTNARIILADEVIEGNLVVNEGVITEIDSGTASQGQVVDCEGDYLSPGLVELHTDNLERHMSPRPKVDWPHDAAIIAHDAELAGVGITTVFDAMRVGSVLTGSPTDYPRYARSLATELLNMRETGALRISHHLHVRAETCSESLTEELDEFGVDDRVGIVSLMDHTPGQRQFRDVSKLEEYVCGKKGLGRDMFDAHVAHLTGLHERLGAEHEAATVAAAKRFGATLASHDDTTAEQVSVSAGHGVTVAEFPTTVEAAEACRAHGIQIIMGAPNLIRGKSHSGNVAARDLAERDLLDIVSSDYIPAALLKSAVQLGDLWGDLPRGMATVTKNPSERSQLDDRGVIEIGKRADLIRFRVMGTAPIVRGVWSNGCRVS